MRKRFAVEAALPLLKPIEWDGSPIDLREYRYAKIDVLTAPGTPQTVQYSPVGGDDAAKWIDWSVRGADGVDLAQLPALRGSFTTEAGGFLRCPGWAASGGLAFISAG